MGTAKYHATPAGLANTNQQQRSRIDETFEPLPSTLTSHTQLSADRAPGQPGLLGRNHRSLQPLLSRPTASCRSAQLTKHDTINPIHMALLDCLIERCNDRIDVSVAQVSRVLYRLCHSDHNHSRYWSRARIA